MDNGASDPARCRSTADLASLFVVESDYSVSSYADVGVRHATAVADLGVHPRLYHCRGGGDAMARRVVIKGDVYDDDLALTIEMVERMITSDDPPEVITKDIPILVAGALKCLHGVFADPKTGRMWVEDKQTLRLVFDPTWWDWE